MNKVTIEITKKGWKTTVQLGGKTIIDEHELTPTGTRGLNESLGYNDDIPNDLYEVLDGIVFGLPDIARELK